ncbi:hypothetical protein [Erythrobacter sp. MTPC3]|uniref:hypothetical protein n=1 Tax=Erythrobacter sp. MTPC3 TaxID=3056564 RepID=UPI0036F2C71C
MNVLQITFLAVLACGGIAIAYTLLAKPTTGNAFLAAMLSAGLGAFTAVQIAQEGVMMFFINHTHNLTGLQVWWDLVMCVVIGLFLIAQRARAAGMNLAPWFLFVGATASIGLLATCARLFWLESRTSTLAGTSAV